MNELLLNLYGCPTTPDRWRPTLDQLCDLVSVRSAVVQVLDYRGGRLRPICDYRDSYSLAHRDEHDRVLNNDSNPRLRLGRPASAPGQSNVVRDEQSFLPGSPELNEIRRRRQALQFGAHMGGIVDLAEGRTMALVLHRSAEDSRPLGEDAENLVSALLPHLRQTLNLSGQFAASALKSRFLAEAGEMLGVGILLCDDEGRMSWANTAAQAILARSTAVCGRGGRIRATRSGESQPFQDLLAEASASADGHRSEPFQLTLGRSDETATVQVLAVGVPGDDQQGLGGAGGVVLLLCEPGRPLDISPDSVADLFGMSAAEARLTASLCNGSSLRDYATQRGISEGTARIQLKRALAKMGAPRQAELVRRVCTSLAASLATQYGRFTVVGGAASKALRNPIC
jgi:DNA-binding CsgD family transcriptional regulator